MIYLFAAIGIAAVLFILAGTANGVRCAIRDRQRK
jgi:hypothetical protein